MTSPLRLIGLGLLWALSLAAAWYVSRGTAPTQTRQAPPDTIWKERQITRTDTVTKVKVRTRTVYDSARVVDTLRVPVPSGFDYETTSLVRPNPLQLTPKTATLTRYDISAQRYVQDTYDIPETRWKFAPEIGIRTTPWGLQARAEAALTWRDWMVTAGYAMAREQRGVTVGLRWQPIEITW